MNELLQYIAELLERVIALLSRQARAEETASAERAIADVRIVDTPVPVRLTSATVQAELDEPIAVEQSGSWTVGISGQPIGVNVQNTPTVNAQQSGNWAVSVIQPDYKYAVISANTSGNTQVVAGVSGKRIVVVAFAVVAAGTVNIQFRSGTTNAITGTMRLVEAGGIAHEFSGGLFRTGVGEALNINLSANVQVGGHLTYLEV
ncbi:MAG: hypothetical protein CFK49_09705 [Armatimonadetes bacterium JP3_11]|jgi:hypothetical protein|nr:MAG: hypothetical protein CFK49_09705 [Armatimonadetes bacterium JP3_11]